MKVISELKKCLFNGNVYCFPHFLNMDKFIKNLKLIRTCTYHNMKNFLEDIFNIKTNSIEDFLYTLYLESRTDLYNKLVAFLVIFKDLQNLNYEQSIECFNDFCDKYLTNEHVKNVIRDHLTNFSLIPDQMSPLFKFYKLDKEKFDRRFNIFVNDIVNSKSTEEVRFYFKMWIYGLYFIDLITYLELYKNIHCGRSINNLLNILSIIRSYNFDYDSFCKSFDDIAQFVPNFLYNCFGDNLDDLDYKLKIAVCIWCFINNENTKNLGKSLYKLISNEYNKKFFVKEDSMRFGWIFDVCRAHACVQKPSKFYENSIYKLALHSKIKLYLLRKLCDVLDYIEKNNIDFLSYINDYFEFTCFLNNAIYMQTITEKDIEELIDIFKYSDDIKFSFDFYVSSNIYMNDLYNLAEYLYKCDEDYIENFKKLIYRYNSYNPPENFIKYYYVLYKDLVYLIDKLYSDCVINKNDFVYNIRNLNNFINYFINIEDVYKKDIFRLMNLCMKKCFYINHTVIPEFILYILSASNNNSTINRIYNVLRSYRAISEVNFIPNCFNLRSNLRLIYLFICIKILNMFNENSIIEIDELEKNVYYTFYEILDNRTYDFVSICKRILQ